MLICWGAFSTRTFIFTGCIKDEIQCRRDDYYNNPGNAIEGEGITDIDEIMSVVDGKLMYRRVPKTRCRPGPRQDAHIFHPQYCKFTRSDGNKRNTTFEAENLYFESPYYTYKKDGEEDVNILTSKDCNPISNDVNFNITKGVPILKWTGYN
jgi:hypothetical protein